MLIRLAVAALVAAITPCTLAQPDRVGVGPDGLGADDAAPELIVRVRTRDQADIARLDGLGRLMDCCPAPGGTSYLVTPDALEQIERAGWEFDIVIHDVGAHLREHQAQRDAARAVRGPDFYADFATYAEFDAKITGLVDAHPMLATRVSAGLSLEQRDMFGIRITAPGDASQRVQMAITGTQHAREWISPMSCFYFAETLLDQYGVDPRITALLDAVEIHVMPMVNPDGYVYSHTSGQRLWRKNRKQVDSNSIGVDLNRNWGFQWNAGLPGSSSGNPDSETYRGDAPFSEPESAAMSAYLQSLTRLRGHVDVHAHGQLILGPWGYDDTIVPPRADELRSIQEAMAGAIVETNGAIYRPGLGVDALLYTADGLMPDWVFGELNAVSWTYELRDTGEFGFVLPPEQIRPTAEEVTNGLLVLADAVQTSVGYRYEPELPGLMVPDAPLTVPVRIFETNLVPLASSAPLAWYRTAGSGSAFTAVELTGSEPEFAFTIPASPCGATIEYYFETTSSDGSVTTSPADAPASLHSIDVRLLVTDFTDDFEVDLGWTISGDAGDGAWERSVPAGGGDRGDPPEDAEIFGIGFCFVTDNEDGNSDVDSGRTILTSPVLNLPLGGRIQYAYWINAGPGSLEDDFLAVEISTDTDGIEWDRVRTHVSEVSAWTLDRFDSPGSVTLRVRFIAEDGGAPSLLEAGIDAIFVERIEVCPPTCSADLDQNGSIDIVDLLLFLETFFVEERPIMELLDFLTVWFPAKNGGACP